MSSVCPVRTSREPVRHDAGQLGRAAERFVVRLVREVGAGLAAVVVDVSNAHAPGDDAAATRCIAADASTGARWKLIEVKPTSSAGSATVDDGVVEHAGEPVAVGEDVAGHRIAVADHRLRRLRPAGARRATRARRETVELRVDLRVRAARTSARCRAACSPSCSTSGAASSRCNRACADAVTCAKRRNSPRAERDQLAAFGCRRASDARAGVPSRRSGDRRGARDSSKNTIAGRRVTLIDEHALDGGLAVRQVGRRGRRETDARRAAPSHGGGAPARRNAWFSVKNPPPRRSGGSA